MTELHGIGPGLNPDDLWRNFNWLRGRIEQLEIKVRKLQVDLKEARLELWELTADQDPKH